MKALQLVDKKKLELRDLPTPDTGPADLLVRVKACGICGSDVHGYDGSTGRRIPPVVMGHEAAGVVERAGPAADGFSPGDAVTFDSTVWCGECPFCRAGAINLCDRRRVLGVSCAEYRRDGCFAEFVAIPARIAYRLPPNMPFEHAAMTEPVSIAVHAVSRAAPALGERAVVVGAGMIGYFVVQALRAAGCADVIALDLDDAKLGMAKDAGATHTLKANAPDIIDQIQHRTAGRGADIVIEAVGANASVQTAVAAARKGGRVVLVGNLSPKVDLPLQAAVTRELTLLGSAASRGEYPACLDMISSGRIRVQPLLSATAPLADGPRWFERLYAHEPGLNKVVLTP
jgi:L-iditol 2-dehydrogenase